MDATPRALISAYDKTGVVGLAAGLLDLGWELIASAGTAREIAGAGLAVTDVADHSGLAEMLGHRVVTLHPRVHAGILADRDDPGHRADLDANGIDPIDLVVVNLYPFEASPGIETIDIGGSAMLRAAAKNHAHVGVLVDPADYSPVLEELRSRGRLSAASRGSLARKAFAHSAAYEAAIARWFEQTCDPPLRRAAASAEPAGGYETAGGSEASGSAAAGVPGTAGGSEASGSAAVEVPGTAGSDAAGAALPALIRLELERAEVLRYGENPHQHGARYRRRGHAGFFDAVVRRGGPAPSYLNLADAEAAWRLAHDLGESRVAVIVKHANPCGVSAADDLEGAYSRALECDPRSAFGGVVAFNAVIDAATAESMVAAPQADLVIAPGYSAGVIARLAARRANTRLLEVPPGHAAGGDRPWELRSLGSAGTDYLVQTPQRLEADPDTWQVVTKRIPTERERSDAVFAWRVCARTSSNAIVLARDTTSWGIGAGQQNRVEAARLAAARAAGRAAGGACASDAFLPFADGVHAAADAGVAVVVQPGGSINDAEVLAAANERGIAMILTSQRQFRH